MSPPTRTVDEGDAELTLLSASASRKDGSVLVSLTNLDAERPVNVELDLRGARVGDFFAYILTADALDAHNTAERPNTVIVRPFDGAAVLDGVLRVALPPHAYVTVHLKVSP